MSDKKTMDVRPCTCASAFQDKAYGKGQRAHTLSQGGKTARATCTVCGAKR